MLYVIAALIILIVDQAVKYWVTANIVLNSTPTTLIPKIVGLTNIHNAGAAFGIFKDARWFFVVLTVVFTGVVIYILKKQIIRGKLGRWSLIMVMAGGLGNCIDRVINGFVVDMFQFQFTKKFAVFNVADMFITVFGIIFCAYLIFHREPNEEPEVLPGKKVPPANSAGPKPAAGKPVAEDGGVFTAGIDTGRGGAQPSGRIGADTVDWKSPDFEDILNKTSAPAAKAPKAAPKAAPDERAQGSEQSAKKEDSSFSLDDIIAEFKDK